MVRTRIAPSPTGEDIHIGNLYTALMNFAWAKKNEGKFIVRIEDTDRERYVKGAEERILGSLTSYGLAPDESPVVGGPYAPYRQSERLDAYKKYAQELIEKGKAYYCFCTRERLDALRKEQIANKQTPRYDKHCLTEVTDAKERVAKGEAHVLRLNVEKGQKVTFHDLIRGDISFESDNVDDQVLIKSDGYPTYHMAVVVDDHLMEISHIIRAEEWISSTPKHVLLYSALGWDLPIFAHMPILRNPDKSKLSKRKNPVWAAWYLEEGYLPEAVLNYLALMGWSHPQEKEIFPLSEFVTLLELDAIKPVGPVFDIQKLTWMNQQWIQKLPIDELKRRIKEFSELAGKADDAMLDKILVLVYTRMEKLKDFDELAGFIFTDPNIQPRNDTEKEIVQVLSKKFNHISEWNKDRVMEVFKEVLSEYKIKMPILYYLFTGNERGLPLPDSLEIIGKENVLKRLTD